MGPLQKYIPSTVDLVAVVAQFEVELQERTNEERHPAAMVLLEPHPQGRC